MEIVGNYPDLASARVAQSLLAASEIESDIPDEYLSGVDWQMGTALHGIVLRVAPEDADAARALLREIAEEPASESEFADSECKACGDDGPEPPRWKRRLKAACLLFAPLILLYGIVNLVLPTPKCPSCGKT